MINSTNNASKGYQFELFLKKLFDYYNIQYVYEPDNFKPLVYMDFILEDKYWVEVMIYPDEKSRFSSIVSAIKKMKEYAFSNTIKEELTFLLIVGNTVDSEKTSNLIKLEGIKILDISNILYLIRNNDILTKELNSILDYSTQNIPLRKPDMEIFGTDPLPLTLNKNIAEYQESLESWIVKDNSSKDYENLCTNVLKTLFNDNITMWNTQQNSNDKLFRFDLICKVKSGEIDGFWKMISDYFNTKYVIFEFKNYTDKITQKEIYTTEKYLYNKALRSVAIIISPHGEDNNSKKAIKGTLRENGKLILSLTNLDLVKMLELFEDSGSQKASEHLTNMLDDILISLEK